MTDSDIMQQIKEKEENCLIRRRKLVKKDVRKEIKHQTKQMKRMMVRMIMMIMMTLIWLMLQIQVQEVCFMTAIWVYNISVMQNNPSTL